MNRVCDKKATNSDSECAGSSKPARCKRKKSPGPVLVVKSGSAAVPIYKSESRGRARFTISYYRNSRRLRQTFSSLEAAKSEAALVARQIQAGLQQMTDLKPHQREAFHAASQMLEETGVPLVAAIEDYVRARRIAGGESLAAMASDFTRHFANVTREASVPDVVKHLIKSKEQDGASTRHLGQIRSVLNRFAAAHPGPIIGITTPDIDAWLRDLKVSLTSRNSMLTYVKLLFSFALAHNYLPEGRKTAAEQLRKVRVQGGDVEIFTPAQLRKILDAAPPHLIPLLAIGAFSGIRMAELARLDWTAVNLDRQIIEVRAGQAKTASRRLIPIPDNLRAWLAPLPRDGKVLTSTQLQREVSALARDLGIQWPHNVLRHSFISYRIAMVNSVDQVALEAGNSASIIFKHYRELTSDEQADEWFQIVPKAI